MPTPFKSARLTQIAEEAIKNELYRQLAATGGNVKAAALNLGYTNPQSFYQVLQRHGIRIERKTRVIPPDEKPPFKYLK